MYRNSVADGNRKDKSARRTSNHRNMVAVLNCIIQDQKLFIEKQTAEIRQCRDLILELIRFNIEARQELDAQAHHAQQAVHRDRGAEQTYIDGRVVSVESKVPRPWQ